ncbi:hypothetical protein AB0M43_16825 [Longispora sp. NPDC051575]|uniref:tetratricopeptide repeat protein n=1 Tax=Longispora sp. NPDC051575 TaxID=3154943 RepID=UPI00341263F5
MTRWEPQIPINVEAYAGSTVAVLGAGSQDNSGAVAMLAGIEGSVAPPFGRRVPGRPLRGRDDLLGTLEGVLTDSAQWPRVRVLHGLSGCGKSSVALELAARADERGIPTWWVSASDPNSMVASLRSVARAAGASSSELQGHLPDELWKRLNAQTGPWLLVIDGANDPGVLATGRAAVTDGTGWLRPHTSQGLVVVTSQDGSAAWGGWCHRTQVEALSAAHGAQVLLDHVGDAAGDAQEAENLARRLGGHPLALELAGAFLTAEIGALIPTPGATRSFEQYRRALADGRLAQDARIDELLGHTLAVLEQDCGPDGRKLLMLLSCLADAPVPFQAFLDPVVLAGSGLFDNGDGAGLSRSLRFLADFSLVRLFDLGDHAPKLLEMHPLVREAGRRLVRRYEAPNAFPEVAAALLRRAVAADDASTPIKVTEQFLFFTHVNVIRDELGNTISRSARTVEDIWTVSEQLDVVVCRLLSEAILSLGGRPGKKNKAFRRALTQLRDDIASRWKMPFVDLSVGIALWYEARVTEAEVRFRRAVEQCRREFDERDLRLLVARTLLIGAYTHEGNEVDGVAESREMLQLWPVGVRDDLMAINQQRLGALLLRLGRHAEAEPELRKALDLHRNDQGAESPVTLETWLSWAATLKELPDPDRALEEFEKLAEQSSRVLGDDHGITRSALAGLSSLRAPATAPAGTLASQLPEPDGDDPEHGDGHDGAGGDQGGREQ